MKVKELINQLSTFDQELEVIIRRYDGVKSYNDYLGEEDLREEQQVVPYCSKHNDNKPLKKAIVIE